MALRVGIVVSHIFMQRAILPDVIFSPGRLSLDLAHGLQELGADVTLFTPGPVDTSVRNVTGDLTGFEAELRVRGDSYIDLLKKHPLIFVSLARQVQSELIARAYDMANRGDLDVVHVYTNEEDLGLAFARLCRAPVVFTHHDPFTLLVRYKHSLPRYADLNWISLSQAQRAQMPEGTNWVANIYHGIDPARFVPQYERGTYLAFMGRIISSKGLHLAIRAVKLYNVQAKRDGRPAVNLKIAGKHYAGQAKDAYWTDVIEPELRGGEIEYVGYLRTDEEKQSFLGGARALVMPSTFDEPFGLVMAEAFACGTPVIGLSSGAIAEVVRDGVNGVLVPSVVSEDGSLDEPAVVQAIADSIDRIDDISRQACRADFEQRFTLRRMCSEHLAVYEGLHTSD